MNPPPPCLRAPISSQARPPAAPENARGLAACCWPRPSRPLAVVADQLIETWIDDHLFLAWIALWAVVFAGSLLLTGTMRRMSIRAIASLDQWAARRARARHSPPAGKTECGPGQVAR